MAVIINRAPTFAGLTIGGAPQSNKPQVATSGLVLGAAAPAMSQQEPVPAADRVEVQLELDYPDHAEHGLDGQAILKYHEMLSRSSQHFSPAKAREAGLYFGYPTCCVDDFIRVYEEGTALPHAGTGGFVPCPKCQEKAGKDPKGVAGLITNRVCARPYPNSVAAEDIRVLGEGRPTATMMRVLRVHMRIDSDTSALTPELIAAEEDKIRRMPKKAYEVAVEYLRGLK